TMPASARSPERHWFSNAIERFRIVDDLSHIAALRHDACDDFRTLRYIGNIPQRKGQGETAMHMRGAAKGIAIRLICRRSESRERHTVFKFMLHTDHRAAVASDKLSYLGISSDIGIGNFIEEVDMAAEVPVAHTVLAPYVRGIALE